MSYDENPADQIHLCIHGLRTLMFALESVEQESLAVTCLSIADGLRDAVERLEAHKSLVPR